MIHGYNHQNFKGFEMIIADDGSNQETAELIKKMKKEVFFDIIHVWHEDDGFQKTKILNKAILASNTPYLLFSDGDCIPRKDFIQTHVNHRKSGYFLSGGYFKLPMTISKKITSKNIYNEKCFDINWLKENGLKNSFKNNKITSKGFKADLLDFITPTTASWNGHNSSGWKKDIVAVNGFDERMQYGGEDRELGERLFNFGIKSKQIRYKAICVHLDHARGYVNQEAIDKNVAIRKETKDQKKRWTNFGIEKS